MKKLPVILFLSAALFYTSCKHTEHQKEETSQFLVTSPAQMDTTLFSEYVCQIKAIQHIELRALEKGYVQNIYVDEGQFVKQGQLMFQIMPMVYQAERQTAQAEANFAEIEYKNTKSLADSNVVSKNELALAKARLDKANAELAMAEAHLGFTEIHAPFDGIMGRFNVRLGSLVDDGELLTTLSDNSKMWVYFNVPEAEYLSYISKKKKTDVPIQVKLKMANNELFESAGVVETIEADFNNETGNIAFRATFQNNNQILRHGETGNILMPIELKDAIIIPQEATFDVLDKKYVYVVDEHNKLNAKQIIISHEMPHLYVVGSGLTSKDKILLEGLGKVKNEEEIECEFKPYKEVLEELKKIHAE